MLAYVGRWEDRKTGLTYLLKQENELELFLHEKGSQVIHAVTPSYRWLETSCPALHNNSNLSTSEVHDIMASHILLHAVGVDMATQLYVSTCSCKKEDHQ
jgi:hypothetical protein